VTAGGFDHVVVLQARGQKLEAFVLMLATPAISLGVATPKAAQYRSPADLKGMKIGVSAPGSSTHMFVNRVLASAGLSSEDVSIVGVGIGPGAVAAVRSGQIDAISNVEPAITMLERSGAIKVVADSMTEKTTRAVFGAALPAGCLYTKEEFIRNHPDTVQARPTPSSARSCGCRRPAPRMWRRPFRRSIWPATVRCTSRRSRSRARPIPRTD
jgi:NitT/TauT family transport system substrate-binding protein